MSREILPAVVHDDLKDQYYLRLILQLKIAPQLKGLFHAICYLFRKQLNSKNNGAALLSVAIDSKDGHGLKR